MKQLLYFIKLTWSVFFRKFWQQLLRLPFTATSGFVTQRVLRLSKPSILERYTNIFIVFTLSGMAHVVNDIGTHNTPHRGTMLFFQSFALGFAVEDGVQELWRRFGAKSGSLEKLVGYTWVLCFMCIVAPWYGYPAALIPMEKRWILPYPVTEKIGTPASGLAIGVGALLLKFAFKAEL
jgi:hypothetical protein